MRGELKALGGNLALATISLGLLLLLFEVGFRLAGYSALDETYAKARQFWERDPLLGWTHRKEVVDSFVGPLPFPVEYETRVTLNAHGLRGEELAARPVGGLRVLFTGDSRTVGFEVEDDQTFAALLSEILEDRLGRPIQTLNAGVRGYGTDQSWLAFRERWRALEPDLVLHMHSFNDPIDNTVLYRAKRIYGKPAFRIDEQTDLELMGTPVPLYPRCAELRLKSASRVVALDTPRSRFFCRLQLAIVAPSALMSFVQARIQERPDLLAALRNLRTPEGLRAEGRGYRPLGGDAERRNDPRYVLTRRLLRAFADEVERSGARFAVAGYGIGLAELGADALREDGLDVIDVSALEEGGGPPIHFVNDVHWNVEGHHRVAQLLAPHLASRLPTRSGGAAGRPVLEPAASPGGSAPRSP